ncbi:hypothetical protein FRC11_008919, partial [Ceratobasidium sp. 423]
MPLVDTFLQVARLRNVLEQIQTKEVINHDEKGNKSETTGLARVEVAVSTHPHDRITDTMSVDEILTRVTKHGCEDVTNKLRIKSFSPHPVLNGGFGDVYRVHLQDGRQLAYKCVRLRVGADSDERENTERTAHELYVWSKCQHRNVLELVGVARFRNQLAIVSPWLDNGDLKCFIGHNQGVDRCALVAEGIGYLHGRGIVHGDLKAANILVSQDGTLKIIDFGNSALTEYHSLRFSSSAIGYGVSIRWTAPEILEEKTKSTVAGDIFALGMTILEIVTGAVPYENVKDVVVLKRILAQVHPSRPEIYIPTGSKQADRLWSLLVSCWKYDGQDRPTALRVRNEVQIERWEAGNKAPHPKSDRGQCIKANLPDVVDLAVGMEVMVMYNVETELD